MTYSLAYWVLMLIWVVFGGGIGYYGTADKRWLVIGGNFVLFLLLLLVGLKLFGQPLHG